MMSSQQPPRSVEAATTTNDNSTPKKTKQQQQQAPIIPESTTSESTQFFSGIHNDNNNNKNKLPRSPRRGRINSRDIPRTYSGLYGKEDDFLPLECRRQQHDAGVSAQSIWFLLITYLVLLGVVHQFLSSYLGLLLAAAGVAASDDAEDFGSWTWTHALHTIFSIMYIHWLKGSIFDPQGELNALTIWEQLEARGSESKAVRQMLLLMPTALTYFACHWSEFRPDYCLANVVLWAIEMLAKLPFMNGVRLFGINRTVGIDDVFDDDNVRPEQQQGAANGSSTAAAALQETERPEEQESTTAPDLKKTR